MRPTQLESTASIVAVSKQVDGTSRLESSASVDEVWISMLPQAEPGTITYYDGLDAAVVESLEEVVVICHHELETKNPNIDYLHVKDPKLVFYIASHLFGSNSEFETDDAAERLFPGASIGVGCQIGTNVSIHPNVVVRSGTRIGDNCVIESGSVIGSSGLMWTWDEANNRKVMLSLTGGTEIGDGSYFCANNSVVRGACNELTTIGKAVMVAPNSAIGHGSRIGGGTHFANGVLIGGTVRIAEHCFLGSGSIVQPGLSLAAGSVLGAGATLTRSADERGVYVGTPAKRKGDVTASLSGVPDAHADSQVDPA